MASKVPKFGAWDGGDNFTVYFDQARKTKHNGMKINPNDPEENPDMFPQNEHQGQGQAQPQTKADTQRKQTKLPQFGAWENEEAAGYTVRFEKARDNRHGGPVVDKNGPQMNRDTAPRVAPSVQGQGHGHGQVRTQAQTQARPVTTRPESREGRAKIPTFGDWENEGGGAGYTGVFDKLKKKHGSNPNPPQPNRDVGPTSTPQDSRAKAPEFGAWEGGEAVQYTEYFDSAKKHKNQRPGRTPNEPQMNRDVGDRGRASPATTAKRESSDDVLRSNGTRGSSSVPVHPKGNQLHPRNGGTRGNPSTSIPEFGSWTSDPSQAEGYTTVFERAKEVKRTPVHHNVPPPRPRPQQQQPHYVHKTQPSCCSIL